MITDVDKVNGRTIRKLHNADKSKCFGFLSGIKDDQGNLSDVKQHGSLTEARNFCGFKHDAKHLEKLALANMPKSANPQNVKGYKAPTNSKSKAA